jgi:hypothetical protein
MIILCSLVVLAGILPFLFHRVYWLRILCVLMLGFGALWQCIFLGVFEAHLIKDIAAQQNGGQTPQDFKTALLIIGQLSRKEMTLFALLFAALMGLALFPFRQSDSKQSAQDVKKMPASN